MSGAARPANVHARSTAAVVASLSIASEARNECSPGGSEATTARARSSCRARSRITTSHPSRASARTAPAPIPAAPPDTSARGRRKFVEECVLAMCHVSHGERTRILLFFPPGVYDVRSDERASKERKEEGGSVGRASRIPPRCTVPHRYRRGARRTRHQTPTTQTRRTLDGSSARTPSTAVGLAHSIVVIPRTSAFLFLRKNRWLTIGGRFGAAAEPRPSAHADPRVPKQARAARV